MKKVLLLTDVNFWEDYSGHRVRIRALIEYLSQKIQLTVINTGPAPGNMEETIKIRFGIEFFILEKNKYLSSAGYGRRLKKLMTGREFDSVIIEYIHSSYFLNYLNGEPQIILDTHDIISERAKEFAGFNHQGALYELSEEQESEILSVYDYVIAVSKPDLVKLQNMAGNEKVLLCPHPVLPVKHPIRDEVRNIVFVASAYLPNKDAINYFIKNCWPAISVKYPLVNLSIYGAVCEAVSTGENTSISLKGFAPDIDQVYHDADIVINPVRFGAGLKIKNIEALAHGRPLITTSHGARGLEPVQNKAFLVADEPVDFIKKIGVLIENMQMRKQLSEAALQYIAEYFSPQQCFQPLIEVIAKA